MKKLTIVVGTVYGNALSVAEMINKEVCSDINGLLVDIIEYPDDTLLTKTGIFLFIVSTTGCGEIPYTLDGVCENISKFDVSNLKYSVISIGDSTYGDNYGAGGKAFSNRLEEHGGKSMLTRLDIDTIEHFVVYSGVTESWKESFKRILNA